MMKNIYHSAVAVFSPGNNRSKKILQRFTLSGFLMLLFAMHSFAQTTYNFSGGSAIGGYNGFYYTEALVTIGGVSYKLSHLGNGSFTNQGTGGSGNSACLKKDGSGGDFLRIERADAQPFQFYGMWLNSSSMYNPPFYQPPYYDIKYYDQNNAEIVAETFVSNVQNETITVSKNLKVNYVRVGFNAIMTFKLDDLIVGPAAASAPTVTTSGINQFTSSAVVTAGNVTSDGGAAVSEKGFVYNTTGTPTIADIKIPSGTGTGTFSQTITGLNSSTLYYVRAYAGNAAGTGYGTQQSLTTAAPFTLVQTHYFNTSWLSTNSQATPFTKYVEGWDITATATGGLVSISRITGTTGTSASGEGAASVRAISSTSIEDLSSVSLKANNNAAFDLQSFRFKYLTKIANTSFGSIHVTGYYDGTAVPGAVAPLNGIAQATGSSYSYTTFDLSSNNNFNNIDRFIITVGNPVSSARLSAIDIDMLNIAPPAPLPLLLDKFSGQLQGGESFLSWTTLQEQNTKDFDVEYSVNASQFSPIGKVVAAGTSNSSLQYAFTHLTPGKGNNYYRLRMNDIDGMYTYSPVINLKMAEVVKGFSIYPNPVISNHFYISLEANNVLPLSYSIVSSDGRAVQNGTIQTHRQKINVPQLEKGNYFIRLGNGQSQKFVL